MSSPIARYNHVFDEFSSLLAFAVSLLQARSGQPALEDRLFYGERIFGKLICHGLTLKRLSPSPLPTQSVEMWDISSNYAVARTLVETYEALAYIALDDIDATEREFRILLWNVHAEERRLEMLRLIGSRSPEVQVVEKKLQEARGVLLGHSFTTKVGLDFKRKVERGETPPYHNKRSDRDAASKIDHDYHKAVIMHLSSHVHTHPFSVHQLFSFQAGDPECLRLMSIPIQYSCGFIAKAIPSMMELFKPGSPELSASLLRALTKWNEVLAIGVKTVDQSPNRAGIEP
jgi:metal-responsive CopG/Arc/MetJ family transcriptional regulator